MDIRINSYIPITNVEGVGTRFAIWVQGCSLHCKGCANSHMWDKEGGTTYDTKDFIELIKQYKDRVEGITWLGGEPLEQIEAVTEISKAVQEIGLSVILFTGYEYSALKDNKDFQELIKYVDILIDGRYEQDKTDYSRAWVGSSNQNYYFLTDRYNQKVITECKNKIEVRISPDNKVVMTGMGDFKALAELVR
ncbi:TPA: anaerobic ribonucleoside-triphosphate reductase activating protein [Candidatus Gastranaerophilales bacterium HUM_20]|nr:anaerobic ribonucleoside-triphosphate reductase-activating protein [Clostridium sp. CAG:729]DAB21333.1 MAG TPA: anaerobic ribonucleoside-triphosphate reductase activating protein [Candidatus Gastranaerophilales bacterium HUM_20]